MYPDYQDIRTVAGETEPLWHDEHGVPRFWAFAPARISNIYSEECCLLEIKCSHCGRVFPVAVSAPLWAGREMLKHLVQDNEVGYGPPPRHACIGDAVESIAVHVMEFWQRQANLGWLRLKPLEVEFGPREMVA